MLSGSLAECNLVFGRRGQPFKNAIFKCSIARRILRESLTRAADWVEFLNSSRVKFTLSDPHLYVRPRRCFVWRLHNFSVAFDDGVASLEDRQGAKLFQVCCELPKPTPALSAPPGDPFGEP